MANQLPRAEQAAIGGEDKVADRDSTMARGEGRILK